MVCKSLKTDTVRFEFNESVNVLAESAAGIEATLKGLLGGLVNVEKITVVTNVGFNTGVQANLLNGVERGLGNGNVGIIIQTINQCPLLFVMNRSDLEGIVGDLSGGLNGKEQDLLDRLDMNVILDISKDAIPNNIFAPVFLVPDGFVEVPGNVTGSFIHRFEN